NGSIYRGRLPPRTKRSPRRAVRDGMDWIGMAQKVGIAIVIIIVTWILAQVVKWAIGKLVGRLSFLQRQGSDGNSLGESLGRVGSLLVWLFGLIAVLQVFALQSGLVLI